MAHSGVRYLRHLAEEGEAEEHDCADEISGGTMRLTTVMTLLIAATMSYGRDKGKDFPLTIKVLAADQLKTIKPPAPAAPANVQVCGGENVDCTNAKPEDPSDSMVEGLRALRAPDTHNAMVVEINGSQVVLTCTRSGGIVGRHLSSCQILLPGEYHARDAGGGHIEIQGRDGKTIKYEIRGTI